MARILVVEDEPDIARLVRRYLESDGFAVSIAYDGEEALALLRRTPVDLIVLDLGLPRRDGWSLTECVRTDPDLEPLPILMLTARVEDADKLKGLRLGADDYVTKPFNPHEVVARVHAILRRGQVEIHARPRVLRVDDLTLDVGQRIVSIGKRRIELTATEFSLCRLLMERPGFVYQRSEIAEEVLGCPSDEPGRTLDTHIKNLRRKIEPDPSHPRYVLTVRGVGYRFARPEGAS
jgi:DNA-binding response OmpR family regulator